VSPARQSLGLGRQLLAFAETEALRRGYREIRLYTHQTMVENQRLYASIGYEETGRGTEDGYDRVSIDFRVMCRISSRAGWEVVPPASEGPLAFG
jgi:ribosomal protein S18 acetylase RimI-like enzyme